MADYNINFKYKGMGSQASGIRQKVLQAQRTKTAKAGATTANDRNQLSSIKTLNSSIQKLIASNKSLESTIKRSQGLGGGGGGGRAPGGGFGIGGGGGIGRVGSSLPFGLGAGVAAMGFAIQKVNQIGRAYIDKMAQQAGSVGVGGFRKGQGMYLGAQMGQGMKAYGQATGRFQGRGSTPNQTALQMGAIYGLSAPETLQTAGQFTRTSGKGAYGRAAAIGMGAGIQSELPMLLQGMAGMMTDAMRDGINTSDMSKDMAKDLAGIVMATPGQSVGAALGMAKSFRGVQTQVSSGRMGSHQALAVTRASQQILMKKLADPEYRKRLVSQQDITQAEADKFSKLGKDAKFSDVQRIAPGAAMYLTKKIAAETNSASMMTQVMKNQRKIYGPGAEGKRKFTRLAQATGWNMNISQLGTAYTAKSPEDMSKIIGKGRKGIQQRAAGVLGSDPGKGIGRQQALEGLLLKHGKTFATYSMAIENSMLAVANRAAPKIVAGMTTLDKNLTALTKAITSMGTDAKGKFGFGTLIKNSIKEGMKEAFTTTNPILNPIGYAIDKGKKLLK